jgi:hypothetical protein
MFLKFLFSFLLLSLSSSAASQPQWRSDPLTWSRGFFRGIYSGINSKHGIESVLREYATPDVQLENPVGTPVKQGIKEVADLSEWGNIHYIFYHIFDAIQPKASDSLAVYMRINVHVNECRTSFPAIVILTFEGEKINSLKYYWDTAALCGTMAPRWNRDSKAAIDFLRREGAALDATLNEGDIKELTRAMGKTYDPEGFVESPMGSGKKAVSTVLTELGRSGLTGFTHDFIEAIQLPTSPNTIATFLITTATIGSCTVSFPDIVIFTYNGGKVSLQQSYWDASLLSECAKQKEL